MIDFSADGHVHSAFSSGRDSVNALVASAERAGLSELTFADRVGPDTSWLGPYLSSIQRAQQRTEAVVAEREQELQRQLAEKQVAIEAAEKELAEARDQATTEMAAQLQEGEVHLEAPSADRSSWRCSVSSGSSSCRTIFLALTVSRSPYTSK